MADQLSIFSGVCWRCWPKLGCKCVPDDTEAECLRAEVFLLDRELQRENRRAREFGDALRGLATAIWQAREARMIDNGLDDLPEDLYRLGEQAQQAVELLAEPRNADRLAALYRELEGVSQDGAMAAGREG